MLLSTRRSTHSRVSAAPNTAAPAAFAHRIREASALHSQAGHGLVAGAASRGSRNRASSDSTNVMRRNSLPKEFLIGPGRCGVHGAKPSAAGLARITLIAMPAGVAAPFLALHVRGEITVGSSRRPFCGAHHGQGSLRAVCNPQRDAQLRRAERGPGPPGL